MAKTTYEALGVVQWTVAYERFLRAGISRDEIPALIEEMGKEHVAPAAADLREQLYQALTGNDEPSSGRWVLSAVHQKIPLRY